ncbi:MAG TPA: SigB/SigF/SigG family RNA polymerase sigma factor [Solirubrobacteraceae bacterium]|jgi:RNA polymerase sigma-B factor|nr:SigB/SigF/SigG family RNA polymerase sigma factor [Solirubrobacteraceae bacterium]
MDTRSSSRAGAGACSPHGLDTDVLAQRWRVQGDRAARDELFIRFLPLARKLAGRYTNPHEPLEDLVQVASLGLLGAIDRFDPERGVRFPAFAIPTILGELKRYFRNTGWSAHVPRGAQEMALRVDRAAKQITADRGRQPRVDELAEYLEVRPEDVLEGLDAGAAHYSVSLDAPVAAADGGEPDALGDSIGHEDETYGLVETRASLSSAVARLPYLERKALALRLHSDMKQTEIARELGCSQMQVSRLLRRAVSKLRELTDPELEPRC